MKNILMILITFLSTSIVYSQGEKLNFEVFYICANLSKPLNDADKAKLFEQLSDFSLRQHIDIPKLKIAIDFIPSSDKVEDVEAAKIAVADVSNYYNSNGIKHIKVTYRKFYELESPEEVCKDIELEICVSK